MRLQPLQKSQVLTGALGEYTVEALQKAALTTFPSIKDAFSRGADRSGGGGNIGYSSWKKHAPRGRFPKKKPRAAHANETHLDEEPGEDEDSDDEGVYLEDNEGSEDEEETEGADDEYDDCPQELEEALAEAEAYLTRAKKQRAEVEKARGFFKKGAPREGRDERVKAMKNKLPCSKCGQLNHWHKDPECPMFGKPFKDKGRGTKKVGRRKKQKKKKKLAKKRGPRCRKAHRVFAITTNGLELPHVAYADTACAKSVCGQDNANEVVEFCRQNDWPYALVDDNEPFRFGPGKRIWSQQALVLAVLWGGMTVVLRFSIVPPKAPFLVSKFVFKRLGGVLDLDANELILKRLNSVVEPIYDLVTGHVGVELVKHGVNPPVVKPSSMDVCTNGEEVTVDDDNCRKALANYTPDHGTHVVDLPEFSERTLSFANDSDIEHEHLDPDPDTEIESDPEDLNTDFLIGMLGSRPLNTRTRAAPFYSELAPGWRARARDLVPSYARNAIVPDGARSVQSPNMVDDVVPSVELGNGENKSGSHS